MKIKTNEAFLEIQKIKDLAKNDNILKKDIKKEDFKEQQLLKNNQDTVIISEKAKEKLNEYNKNYFNEDKVNEIKEKLINNSYKINNETIAKKMIEFKF